MNGRATTRPLIDKVAAPPSVRRLLLLGAALIVIGAALALLGHAYGEVALLAIFACFAAFGVLALFAVALGFVQISARTTPLDVTRRLLDSSRSGTIVVDRRGRIIYANHAYGEILGVRAPSEVQIPERAFAGEPEAAEAIYHLTQIARDDRDGHREFRLPHPLSARREGALNAEPHWYRVSVQPLNQPSGAAHAWQIVDVTEERRLQERSFQDLQDAIDYLDHAPAGFVAADEDFRIAYVNATLAEWLGIDLAAFRPFELTFLDFVPSEFRDLFSAEANEGIVDIDLATTSGRRLPVRLLRRPAGETASGRGSRRMLVLNRLADNESPHSGEIAEARFTRFFNSSPMAIGALDETGRIARSNAAFRSLIAPAGDAAFLVDRLKPRSREAFGEALATALDGRAVPPLDAEIDTEQSRVMRLYISGIPKTGVAGEEVVIVYGVDITEQRALEEQFAKSQKMQAVGNLAGGIAHDFNNVLTVITGSVDFLLLNHRTGDPSFQDLLLIKQNANRAASLVRQLLAYSRRQTMRPKMLNLTDVIADMHLLLKRVCGDIVKLERSHARDLWPVMADIGQFEQVITNLVQNARDAMPDGGTVTILTHNVSAVDVRSFGHAALPEADYVLVEVADDGTGMPPEVAERIFEPFFTTKDIGRGTGLGLSMVYGIIEQTGGHIFVDTKLGEGTAFRIFLPRHAPNEVELTSSEVTKTAGDPKTDLSGTESILLVEDEDNVRAMNMRSLKMRGYEVHEAASGLEALEILEDPAAKIDLVVSDVMMPEMDGPTLLKEMRKTHPDLKFIFVSGYAEEAFAKNLPEGEKFGFLAKPFSLRELAIAVRKMFDDEGAS